MCAVARFWQGRGWVAPPRVAVAVTACVLQPSVAHTLTQSGSSFYNEPMNQVQGPWVAVTAVHFSLLCCPVVCLCGGCGWVFWHAVCPEPLQCCCHYDGDFLHLFTWWCFVGAYRLRWRVFCTTLTAGCRRPTLGTLSMCCGAAAGVWQPFWAASLVAVRASLWGLPPAPWRRLLNNNSC